MRDTMTSDQDRNSLLLAAGLACAVLLHWVLFPLACIAAGITLLRNRETQAALYIGAGALMLMVGLGYGLGKQMALRDNLRCTAPSQQHC